MHLLKVSLTIAILLSCFCSKAQLNKTASEDLIKRLLPRHAKYFVVEAIEKNGGRDVFEIESKGKKIIIRGNNGVSVASGLNYYLKNYAHCDIGWNGTNLNLPSALPVVVVNEKIRIETPYARRFYLNYCTYNYTMSWWDWKRWQWEIDWMALNGINMPLALTGQDIVWSRVYKKLGFSDKELESFFAGPGYSSWFWLGCLDGWGGPLPQSWMVSHEALQKQILTRQRELGMTPVLPAFTGHVPPLFKDKFPNVKLKTIEWVNFAPVYILEPSESMFTEIGKMFIEEQTKIFGSDHLYSADTFIESIPPSSDSTYLNDISRKVYESMSVADPKAIWVMQAWMIQHNDSFWKPTQVRALLNAVPNDKMIILDLFGESHPVWDKTDAYHGKPWIWNMLHNFGGNIGMFGRMDVVASTPAKLLNDSKAGNMVGIGLVPEGLEQNPVINQLMLDNIWRNKPIELDIWLDDYALRRYGKKNTEAEQAWKILRKTAYSGGRTSGTPKSIVSARPTFEKYTRQINPQKAYKDKGFIPAWDKMINASGELKNSEGFQYDLVDITRQSLANYADVLQQQFSADFKTNNLAAFTNHSNEFLMIIDDLDRLLGTRKDFLLGSWLNSSKAWGTNAQEKKLYEMNARNLITVWGDTTCRLNDYSARQWNGMMKGFYKPRWQKFITLAKDAMQQNQPVDLKAFESAIRKWEWEWVNSQEVYRDRPEGDPVKTAIELHKKYRNDISANYQ